MAKYPKARWYPSPVSHPKRSETRGICMHNTYGSKAGDLSTLTGGKVDCHFYVSKDGTVYQLLDTDSKSWTAMATANATCLHIEMEGKREVAWTVPQFEAAVALLRWLTKLYGIPVVKVDPPTSWRGLFDHRDLQGIDGNDHGDGVSPSYPGWNRLLAAIREAPVKLTLPQRIAAGFRAAKLGDKSVRALMKRLGYKEADYVR